MNLRSSQLVAACLAYTTIVGAVAVNACDCAPPTDAEQAFNDSDAVFVGIIADQQPDFSIIGCPPPYRSVNFEVLQSWKGVVGSEVGVITWPGGSLASCGLLDEVGDKLLVYATMNANEGALETWMCGVHSFDCPNDGCKAEEHIAEFSRLGFEELALSEGPERVSPPGNLNGPGSMWALCGVGIGSYTLLSIVGLLAIAKGVRAVPIR